MRLWRTPHPCFLAVPIRVRISGKFFALWSERKQPEIFSLSFINVRPSRLLWLLVNGTSGLVRKRRTASLWSSNRFARLCPTRRLGRPARGCHSAQLLRQSREAFVKSDGKVACNDGIVAPSDEVDQLPIWGLLFVPTQMLDMASTTQQRLHKARPIFPVPDLGQRSESSRKWCALQSAVFNARHREVRLPVVMHHDAAHAAQHVTAIGADTVVSQPSVAAICSHFSVLTRCEIQFRRGA